MMRAHGLAGPRDRSLQWSRTVPVPVRTHGHSPTSLATSMKKALVLVTCVLCIAAPAQADLALARSKNCMSCHAVERKVLGPAFKDVAARYKGNAGAVDLLATKIRKGGAGVWGPVPMPANNQVSEAEAKTLATWVLATPQ